MWRREGTKNVYMYLASKEKHFRFPDYLEVFVLCRNKIFLLSPV